MDNQIIISIGREFGSGGHAIAEELSKQLGIKLYDKNIIEEISKEENLDKEGLESFDEKPVKSKFLYRRVRDYSNSMEENLALLQFDFLKRVAASGESFIIVGRCAEVVLKDNKSLISVFILGDEQEKCKRIMERYNLDKEAALEMMKKQDKERKQYHNHYSEYKWGDSRGYDLSINSSKLGVGKTTEIIMEYIKIRNSLQG